MSYVKPGQLFQIRDMRDILPLYYVTRCITFSSADMHNPEVFQVLLSDSNTIQQFLHSHKAAAISKQRLLAISLVNRKVTSSGLEILV